MQLGNAITIQTQEQLDSFIEGLNSEFETNKYITITIDAGTRTVTQNKALHLYYRMVAKALQEAGIDTAGFFKEGYSMPFTEHIVKDELWLPLMKAVTKKEHTSKLDKPEVSKIYEHLNAKLAEKGIHVPFPNNDNLMNSQRV